MASCSCTSCSRQNGHQVPRKNKEHHRPFAAHCGQVMELAVSGFERERRRRPLAELEQRLMRRSRRQSIGILSVGDNWPDNSQQ